MFCLTKKIAVALAALLLGTILGGAALAAEVVDDEPFMTGTVVDGTMSTLTIAWTDGGEYTFYPDDETDYSGLKDGVAIGNLVVVTYAGTIDWDNRDASGVKVLSVADAASADDLETREATVTIQGQLEEIVQARYAGEGYAIWYDRDAFAVSAPGVFSPVDPDALPPVECVIAPSDETAEAALATMQKTLTESGYALGEPSAWTVGEYPAQGVLGSSSDGVQAEGYVVSGNGRVFTITLLYPEEAAEGYGARLEAMLTDFEILD